MKAIFDRIVLILMGAALSLVALALVDFLLHPLAPDYTFHSPLYRAIAMLFLTPLTLLFGFLIIRRVPGNVVGPLLILWSGTVVYNSIRADIAPELFALFYYYDLVFGWLSLFLMVLHFPDGKIYPPGAAPWVYRQLGVNIILNNLIFLSTAILQVSSQMANPFYLPALQAYAGLILGLGLLFFLPILALNLISPVLRYQKGSYLERQQIKWLGLFAGASVIYVILVLIAYPLLTGGQTMTPGNNLFAMFFYLITGLFPPFAIGVAVLRHRLWDFDLIIRRTLVYSILTVVLSLVYFGSVVSLQELFQQITRQRQSPVATVLSTLAIAALFTPLRRLIQERIDHRFYRQKYNAEQVLAAFNKTMRDEVDMERLTNSILDVVNETMNPALVSLWRRKFPLQPRGRQVEENSSQSLR